MDRHALAQLESYYDALQAPFRVREGSKELAEAVHFGSNRSRPVHRWFHFKEGFSAELLSALAVDTSALASEEAIFLDPFCGSGTTLLAADIEHGWGAQKVGVEINPFLTFVSRTKTSWRDYNPAQLRRLATEVLSEPLSKALDPTGWPALSTFHNHDIFEPQRLSELIDSTNRISNVDSPERDLLLLGVAAAAERVGFYRKDGRALRILRSPGEIRERARSGVAEILRSIWSTYEMDLVTLRERDNAQSSKCKVLEGDGRTLRSLDSFVSPEQVALAVYSPPYLNHIDYTEVYKVELWLLGFVRNQIEMLNLRKQTLRSHASIAVKPPNLVLPQDLERALQLATSLVTATGSKWQQHFKDLAMAYLSDLRQTLERQYELLQPGGRVICVVANSAHGAQKQRVPIAVDLFIASIADSLGFEVEDLVVARRLRRRNHLNRFLRETALIFRRPANT
jgi:SAM-dependent methyltransferase